jgi:phosphate transport system permease protein
MSRPPVTKHTKRVRLNENLARGFIFLLSGLTVAILAWILFYIFWKGFRYDNQTIHPVVALEADVLPAEETGVVFLVNSRIKTDSVTIFNLKTLWGKPRAENWGFYSGQDIKAAVFAFAEDTPWNRSVQKLLFRGLEEESFLPYTRFVESAEEMISFVAKTPGGTGYLRESDIGLLKGVKGVRILKIRRMALTVHPGVAAVSDTRQLSFVPDKQVSKLLSGDIANWKELGGPDLPVILLGDSPDLPAELGNTPGAVALYPADLALEAGLATLVSDRRETGWNLTPSFIFEPPARSGQWGGISWIIINTLFLILFTLLFSTPIGIAAAIFLVEYSRQNRFVALLRMGTETLAGIPSIVFGLFGYIVFVEILNLGKGFISSTLSVTLMILPTIIRTAEESLKSVPGILREGSLAMGASRLQTVFRVVIPAALPGILTGIILAIGRTVGETAVLLYTLGSNMDLVRGPASSARVLSLHLYILFSEALSFDRAFATGAVLILIVLAVNIATSRVVGWMNRYAGRL